MAPAAVVDALLRRATDAIRALELALASAASGEARLDADRLAAHTATLRRLVDRLSSAPPPTGTALAEARRTLEEALSAAEKSIPTLAVAEPH